jgi:hypothetical protein
MALTYISLIRRIYKINKIINHQNIIYKLLKKIADSIEYLNEYGKRYIFPYYYYYFIQIESMKRKLRDLYKKYYKKSQDKI